MKLDLNQVQIIYTNKFQKTTMVNYKIQRNNTQH